MSTRDELAMAMLRARSVIPESNRGEWDVADALIAEGWRKKPSREDAIEALHAAVMASPEVAEIAVDAILALMDRGQ